MSHDAVAASIPLPTDDVVVMAKRHSELSRAIDTLAEKTKKCKSERDEIEADLQRFLSERKSPYDIPISVGPAINATLKQSTKTEGLSEKSLLRLLTGFHKGDETLAEAAVDYIYDNRTQELVTKLKVDDLVQQRENKKRKELEKAEAARSPKPAKTTTKTGGGAPLAKKAKKVAAQ
jgi:hypothetical protein